MVSVDYPMLSLYTDEVTVRIAYPFDPDDLEATNPPFVQDLIDLKLNGYTQTVAELCKMIADLKHNGVECRFLKQLRNYAMLELKSRSRGGQKGGARAYLFRIKQTFLICRAEWKPDNEPSLECLEDTAYILKAFKERRKVFPPQQKSPPLPEQEE